MQHTVEPRQWRRNVKQTVFVAWDHCPVWLKCTGDEKVILSEAERLSRRQRKRRSQQAREAASVAVARAVAQENGAAVDSANQVVGPGSGSDQKSRLTLILFQSVEGWFDPDAVPSAHACVRSQLDKTVPSLYGILLVKCSRHCRQRHRVTCDAPARPQPPNRLPP